jgi:hypothetical protein
MLRATRKLLTGSVKTKAEKHAKEDEFLAFSRAHEAAAAAGEAEEDAAVFAYWATRGASVAVGWEEGGVGEGGASGVCGFQGGRGAVNQGSGDGAFHRSSDVPVPCRGAPSGGQAAAAAETFRPGSPGGVRGARRSRVRNFVRRAERTRR